MAATTDNTTADVPALKEVKAAKNDSDGIRGKTREPWTIYLLQTLLHLSSCVFNPWKKVSLLSHISQNCVNVTGYGSSQCWNVDFKGGDSLTVTQHLPLHPCLLHDLADSHVFSLPPQSVSEASLFSILSLHSNKAASCTTWQVPNSGLAIITCCNFREGERAKRNPSV